MFRLLSLSQWFSLCFSLGLVSACRSFCRELADRYDVEIKFDSENVPKILPKDTSLCLFRVLQEALQNAVKYSGVREFQASLKVASDVVELRVHDSGCGFDPKKGISGTGLGLASMKERLKLIDGQLLIESDLNCGTTIYARVPLNVRATSAVAVG